MAKIRITYTDEARADDVVSLGAFAQIATKRRYGLDVVKSDDPEPVLFGVFVELVGPQQAAKADAFDEWLMLIDTFKIDKAEDEDEDPPEAETSSPSSLDSPPTSDSIPAP